MPCKRVIGTPVLTVLHELVVEAYSFYTFTFFLLYENALFNFTREQDVFVKH